MNKPRGKETAPDQCQCRACQNLRVECGDANYPFLASRLLIRGWAGVMTPAEKAYRRAHSEAAQRNAERMQGRGFLPPKHRETTGQLAFPVGESGAAK